MKIILEQIPIAKARHRTRTAGKIVYMYDPQSRDKERCKNLCAMEIKRKLLETMPEGPIALYLGNYIPMPRSWSTKRKNESEGLLVDKKPDVDNYVKFYSDVMNEIAYRDDAQISILVAEKRYSKFPRVEISLISCKDNPFVKVKDINFDKA